jgi:3-hydroxybutyryl-CoA dehydrogenase
MQLFFTQWEKQVMEVRKIAVLGAGLMGHGICQVAAQSGFHVWLRDVEQRFVDQGMAMIRKSLAKFESKGSLTREQVTEILDRIHPTLDLEEAVKTADLIIEAVPERPDIKIPVFQEADKHAPAHAILASNTSSISITQLGSATKRPAQVCGMHFFNPPQLMRLVEVIRGMQTSADTIQTVLETAGKMGKETVLVKKDSPGFIVNRILIPALNEAVALYWEDVADRDDIDKAIKLGLNWPMGPLMLLDYIGADTTLAIADVLTEGIDPRFHPTPGLQQMVRAKLLGRKTGKGFYDWTKKK